MSKIAEKVKDKLKDAKDTVVASNDNTGRAEYDSTQRYETSEPMSPAKRYTKAMGIAALAGALLFAAIAVPLTIQSAAAAGANMTKDEIVQIAPSQMCFFCNSMSLGA